LETNYILEENMLIMTYNYNFCFYRNKGIKSIIPLFYKKNHGV